MKSRTRERYEAMDENSPIPAGWVKRSAVVYDDMYGYRCVTLCPACAVAVDAVPDGDEDVA